MKVKEVLERLNENEPLAVIAKQLNISPYSLSKKLRILGYVYDSKSKKRIFVGKGEERLDFNILDPVLQEVPNTLMIEERMYEELVRIRTLLERVATLSSASQREGERVRRSFSIEIGILQHLDDYARITGMQKSRIVEAALIKWIHEWEGKVK
ncbi:CopG family transcriptional regulator [Ectobacillus polymachus]|uniref:CopG family transcriptional regulator n=1 Tax=Ectobacillus polymachus TaxID=1508806 RepID=UPI003A8AA824